MAGLVFLLVFWVLAGACQGTAWAGLLCNSSSSYIGGHELELVETYRKGKLCEWVSWLWV